jgi:hypothetical protein
MKIDDIRLIEKGIVEDFHRIVKESEKGIAGGATKFCGKLMKNYLSVYLTRQRVALVSYKLVCRLGNFQNF